MKNGGGTLNWFFLFYLVGVFHFPLPTTAAIKTQLESRFNQVKLEELLVDPVNSDDFSEHLEELQRSCFGTDFGRLGHQLHLVHDAVRTALPEVRQITLPSDDSRTTL